MESVMLRNLVEVQASEEQLQGSREHSLYSKAPAKAVTRTYPGAPFQIDPIELHGTGPSQNDNAPTMTPHSEDVFHSESRSRTSEPMVAEVVPGVWQPYMNRWRLLAVCIVIFGNALVDGAAGALLPYIENYYDVTYGVVSLIFVGQALGFLLSAVFLDSLRTHLGSGKLFGLGQICLTLAFIPLISGAPFVVVVFSFVLLGFGEGVGVAIANTFGGGLQNATFMLGLVHGCYGIGGTTGPLVATALVTIANAVWNRYYILTLGFGAITIGLVFWAFWNYEKEQQGSARMQEAVVAHSLAPAAAHSSLWSMLSALKLRLVLLGSLFIFAYQGAEVSISGWVISFLITTRGGNPSSVGYVTAGFWGGITLGRFLLSIPAQRFGEKRFVYIVTAGAVAFQLLVWLVPNIIGEAVAVSIVGLLLGPVYPCAAAVFMRSMTRSEALSGMGTISAFGSMGGAVAPFLTGLLAQAVGTFVLHPIVIFLYVVMLVCWYIIPSENKQRDE